MFPLLQIKIFLIQYIIILLQNGHAFLLNVAFGSTSEQNGLLSVGQQYVFGVERKVVRHGLLQCFFIQMYVWGFAFHKHERQKVLVVYDNVVTFCKFAYIYFGFQRKPCDRIVKLLG